MWYKYWYEDDAEYGAGEGQNRDPNRLFPDPSRECFYKMPADPAQAAEDQPSRWSVERWSLKMPLLGAPRKMLNKARIPNLESVSYL